MHIFLQFCVIYQVDSAEAEPCVCVCDSESQDLLMVDPEGVTALSFWDYPIPVTLLASCSLLQKKAGFLI